MRLAVAAALVLGLLIAADMTYLGVLRSLDACDSFEKLLVKGISAIEAGSTRQLTHEEQNIRDEIRTDKLSQVRRHIEEWQGGSYAALGFLGCGLGWLVLILAARGANEPGSLLHASLKGSIVGSIVVGTCLTCFFGIVFWLAGGADRLRTYERYEWEVRWLIGAIGGAAIGAILGLLAGTVLKLSRRPDERRSGEETSVP